MNGKWAGPFFVGATTNRSGTPSPVINPQPTVTSMLCPDHTDYPEVHADDDPRPTRDHTLKIFLTGHTLRCGLTAPPSASQAAASGVARETQGMF
jgi:hypothetical protein